MKSINFESGIKEYAINGDESKTIRINVTDLNLLKRIEDIAPKLTEIQNRYKDMKQPTPQQFFDMDVEIRELFNGVFGSDICTPAFGDTNCVSVNEQGEFLFVAFFNAFIPLLKEDILAVAPKREIRPEVSNYLRESNEIAKKPIAALANPYDSGIDTSSLTKEQKMALVAQLLS